MHTTPDASLPLDPGVTDAALASRAGAGDQAAFELIMRRHNRLLFRTARSVLKSDEEAQDALQEAYLRAWRSLSRGAGACVSDARERADLIAYLQQANASPPCRQGARP